MTNLPYDSADWQCSNCKRINMWTEFCPECGARTGIYCPHCHVLTSIKLPFCHKCAKNKEEYYQQQKIYAIEALKQQMQRTRNELSESEGNLSFPMALQKSVFIKKNFSCSRLIGGLMIMWGIATYFFVRSLVAEREGSELEIIVSTAILLGTALYIFPALLGFIDAQKKSISSNRQRLQVLTQQIHETEKINFIEWLIIEHQNRSKYTNQSQSNKDSIDYGVNEDKNNDEYWQDEYRKERDRQREEEKKEQEIRDLNDYWDDREAEERKQQEEYDAYEREQEEKRARDEEDY